MLKGEENQDIRRWLEKQKMRETIEELSIDGFVRSNQACPWPNKSTKRQHLFKRQTIPPAIEGQDILGCAQTGTGKTAAFALPILDYLGHNEPQDRSASPDRPDYGTNS